MHPDLVAAIDRAAEEVQLSRSAFLAENMGRICRKHLKAVREERAKRERDEQSSNLQHVLKID